MIKYTHFKINLGLSVLSRRGDGYHSLQSVMYEVRDSEWSDTLEFMEGDKGGDVVFSCSGLEVDCPVESNLCVRAVRLLESRGFLPEGGSGVRLHLDKRLPFGAGLGAGSANGVGVLCGINDLFGLGLGLGELEALAGELGSDTVFFVRGGAAVIGGRGELVEPIDLSLGGYYLGLVKPAVGVSTALAYGGIVPRVPDVLPCDAVRRPIEQWRGVLENDFEGSVFSHLPVLGGVKQRLYDMGAVYSAMSGSGSTVYGIFRDKPSAAAFSAAFSDSMTRIVAL